MHVDEAGRDQAIFGVDDARRGRPVSRADGDDAVAANADVGAHPRIPGSIDDAGIGIRMSKVACAVCPDGRPKAVSPSATTASDAVGPQCVNVGFHGFPLHGG